MNIKIFKSEPIKGFEKFKNEFMHNYYLNRKEECGVFHINDVKEKIHHMVFYIGDEYQSGTKFIGNIHSLQMDIYINVFIFEEYNIITIENIYDNYINLINEKLENLFQIKLNEFDFDDIMFRKILNNFARKIKRIDADINSEYNSTDDGITSQEIINNNDAKIKFIVFTPNIDTYYKNIISIKNNGKINISTETPIGFIEILNEMVKILE